MPLEDVVIEDELAEECFCQQAQPHREMRAMVARQEKVKNTGFKAAFVMKGTIC